MSLAKHLGEMHAPRSVRRSLSCVRGERVPISGYVEYGNCWHRRRLRRYNSPGSRSSASCGLTWFNSVIDDRTGLLSDYQRSKPRLQVKAEIQEPGRFVTAPFPTGTLHRCARRDCLNAIEPTDVPVLGAQRSTRPALRVSRRQRLTHSPRVVCHHALEVDGLPPGADGDL